MKTLTVLFALLLVGLIAIGVNLRSATKSLQRENGDLSGKVVHLAAMESENHRLHSIRIDTNVLVALRGEQQELMRLRAQAARWRPVSKQSKTMLEGDVRRREMELETANARLDMVLTSIVLERNTRLRGHLSHHLMSELKEHLQQYGQLPTSLEQFRPSLTKFAAETWNVGFITSSDLPSDYVQQVNYDLGDFELMQPPTDYRSTVEPYLILRERLAHQVGGEWMRDYGVMNHRFEMIHAESEDGDFEEWESNALNNLD